MAFQCTTRTSSASLKPSILPGRGASGRLGAQGEGGQVAADVPWVSGVRPADVVNDDRDVQAAERRQHVVEVVIGRRGVRDEVAHVARAACADFFGHSAHLLLVAAVEDQVEPPIVELLRDGFADPVRGPGHEGVCWCTVEVLVHRRRPEEIQPDEVRETVDLRYEEHRAGGGKHLHDSHDPFAGRGRGSGRSGVLLTVGFRTRLLTTALV